MDLDKMPTIFYFAKHLFKIMLNIELNTFN